MVFPAAAGENPPPQRKTDSIQKDENGEPAVVLRSRFSAWYYRPTARRTPLTALRAVCT